MNVFIKLQELLLASAIISETIAFDYCTIKSCPNEHTLCKYTSETIACPGDGVKGGLTEELKKAILDRHNVHRQRVALGKQSPQPHASNMMKLSWHEEAEKIAQRWANQCVSSHDSCRALENSAVGQNFASHSISLTSPDVKGTIVKMVDMWYDEVKDFTGKVDSFEFVGNTAHYTQVVWAESTAIGCGFIELAPQTNYMMANLFCNYVPSGNFMRSPLYKRGKACSECPEGTECSKEYPGLCTSDKDDFGGVPTDDAGGDDDYGQGDADDEAILPKPSVFVLLCLLLGLYWFCDVLTALLNFCYVLVPM